MQNKVNFLKSKVMYVFMTLCVSVLCAVCMGSVAKATGTPSVVKDKTVTFVKHWKSTTTPEKTEVAKGTAVKFHLTLEGTDYYLWVHKKANEDALEVAKTTDDTTDEAVPQSWVDSVTFGPSDTDQHITVSAAIGSDIEDDCIEEWNIVATGCAHSSGITGTASSDFEITDGATMYQNSFREMDIEPKDEAWHVSSGPESGLSAARTYTLSVQYISGTSTETMGLVQITTVLGSTGSVLHPVDSLTVEILASDYLKFKDPNETGEIVTKGLSTLVFEYGRNECDFQLDICWNADGDLAYKLKNAPAEILASLSTAPDLTLVSQDPYVFTKAAA